MANLIANRFLVIACVLLLVDYDASAQDWAAVAHFAEDNKEVGLPESGEQRVVFIGDSITEAWSLMMPELFASRPYINRGISGQTTPQMLVRFRQDVIRLEPSVVVILAGTNDIAENTGPISLKDIAGNIISMAELARANGIRVVLCSVLPAEDYPWRPGKNPDMKIPQLNALIQNYASTSGDVYLDYFSSMTDGNNGLQPSLTSDGVHVTKGGYQLMAELVETAIQQAVSDM